MATSSLPTRPRSPCSESTGWRNEAGLPVEVSVAAILRAISPDLPMPETISRPVAFSSSRTAAEKRSEEHTSELQSQSNLVCRLLLEKKKKQNRNIRVEEIR